MLGFLKIFGRSRHLLRADKQAVWDKNAADLRAAATPEQRDIICLTAWCRITARRFPCRRVRSSAAPTSRPPSSPRPAGGPSAWRS